MKNTNLDDICAVIGFTATTSLVAWYEGANLYVPANAAEDHALVSLIGGPALRALVREWGGETIWIASGDQGRTERRYREIAEMIVAGKGSKDIAKATGLTERRVQQVRAKLESDGVLPLVLKTTVARAATQACREIAVEKGPSKNAGQNPRQKAP